MSDLFDTERPPQEPPTSENRLQGYAFACGCKLPPGFFRRGTHHFYTKDGKDYAYERCMPSTVKRQRAMMAHQGDRQQKKAKLR